MVFLSVINMVRTRGPSRFWNRRRIFMLSSRFWGRKRNCYSVAIRAVHRSLQCTTASRPLKKMDMANLWESRIEAGCEEHGISMKNFHEGLVKSDVFLNRKVLADLAAWEPRTFKALTSFAWVRAKEEGRQIDGQPPDDVHLGGFFNNDGKHG